MRVIRASRSLPPVASPLTAGALLSGVRALVDGDRARRAVEKWAATAYGGRLRVWTDSGTTALRLALEGLRRSGRAPIALPAYSCYSLATAANGAGVEVLLYDVDPTTLSPDLDSLEGALRVGVGAVVVVHQYGISVEMRALTTLTSRYGATIVEDAAQGAGGEYDGRRLGTLGSLALLSFGRGKGVTAGRGGLLLAGDESGKTIVSGLEEDLEPPHRGLSGWVGAIVQWVLGRPRLYAIPRALPFLGLGETAYQEPWPPSGLPHISAGLLAVTCARAEREADERRAHARRLLSAIGSEGVIQPIRPPAPGKPGYLRLPVLVAEAALKAARSATARRLGIMPGYPKLLHQLPEFRERVLNRGDSFPGAERLTRHLFTLPTHSLLREADLTAIETWLGKLPIDG